MSEDKKLNDKFAEVLRSNEIDNAFATVCKLMEENDVEGSVKFDYQPFKSKKKYKVTIERID